MLINAAGCIIKTGEVKKPVGGHIGKMIPPGWVLHLNSFFTAWVNQTPKFKKVRQASDGIIVQDEKVGVGWGGVMNALSSEEL